MVPRPDQEHVAHDDPAARRAPARLEDVRARQVAARGRHLDVGRPEPEPAGVAVEDRPEHARRVEARQAEPLDVAVRRHERAGLAVRQEAVLGDRRERAGRDAPVGRPLRHRRAAAAGSSSAITLPSTSDPGARGSGGPAKTRSTASALSSPVIEEDDLAARVHHRQRERDPRHQGRHSRGLHAHHAPFALAERVVAGEQRADVRVGADPEQDQVERRGAELVQLVLVGGRPVLGAELAAHAVDRRALGPRQERALGHAEVRVLVVGRHAALVREPEVHARPVLAQPGRALVGHPRRRAARERHVAARGGQELGRLLRGIVETRMSAFTGGTPRRSRAPGGRRGRGAAPGGSPRRGSRPRPRGAEHRPGLLAALLVAAARDQPARPAVERDRHPGRRADLDAREARHALRPRPARA